MSPQTLSPSSHIDAGSLRLDLFGQILLAIFRGELKSGSRLKTLHLAAHFGVSSTPVREAIVELAGLGVVEMYPNRGAVVAPFGEKEVREMYNVRRLLEAESARLACKFSDLSEIERITVETAALQAAPRDADWISKCVEVDRNAHQAISRAAGDSRLQAELNRYNRLMHIIRSLLKDWEPYLANILREHLKFLDAILLRDESAASQAMSAHMQATCERAVEGLFRIRDYADRLDSVTKVVI